MPFSNVPTSETRATYSLLSFTAACASRMNRAHRVLIEQHVLAQHLDRDALVQREVRALGDHAHAALAEDRLDAILAQEYLADADARVGWFDSSAPRRENRSVAGPLAQAVAPCRFSTLPMRVTPSQCWIW